MKKTLFFALCCAALTLVSCEKDTDNKKGNGGEGEGTDPVVPEVVADRVLEDFENGGMLEWTPSGGGETYAVEIVDNPDKDGINKSDKCAKVTSSGAQWEFLWSTGFGVKEEGDPFEFLDFTNKGYIIRVMVKAPKANASVYLAIEGVDVPKKEVQTVKTTKANEWEVLEFDYETMEVVDNAYKNFVILFDAGATDGAGEVWYFDNIEQYVE